MLNASSHVADDASCDIFADIVHQPPLRSRWRNEASTSPPPKEMRLVLRIDMQPGEEGETEDEGTEQRSSNPVLSYRYWYWYERLDGGDELGGRTSKQAITWDHHTEDVTSNATKIADKLLAHAPDLHLALVTAARWHDLGKMREVWQRSIGRPSAETEWYAKSDPNWPSEVVRTPYRHEFGSLVDIQAVDAIREEFQQLSPGVQDLVLHLIAVHHGNGRPHFSEDRAFDPEPRGTDTSQIASEVPRRYARLQRQYRRWGLAYLESLLRAADAAASAHPSTASLSTEESHS